MWRILKRSVSTIKKEATEYPNHAAFFKRLGLEFENKGVYNGSWTGNGPVIKLT